MGMISAVSECWDEAPHAVDNRTSSAVRDSVLSSQFPTRRATQNIGAQLSSCVAPFAQVDFGGNATAATSAFSSDAVKAGCAAGERDGRFVVVFYFGLASQLVWCLTCLGAVCRCLRHFFQLIATRSRVRR